MRYETITTQEYARRRGIGDAAVRKAIKLGHQLPGVISRSKFGRVHVLKVDTLIVPALPEAVPA